MSIKTEIAEGFAKFSTKLFGKSEKVLAEEAAQALKAKAAQDAEKAAQAAASRAKMTPEQAADHLKAVKEGGQTAAEAEAKKAAEATAKKTAEDVAAKASINAATNAPNLSYLAARRIANGSESLTSKIELLHRGGRDDMVERVIAKARLGGEINMDVARTLGRSDAIPDALKARITNIAANRADAGFLGINGRIESVKAFADYARHFPISSTLQVAKDATLGTLSTIRKHPFMTAIGLGGAHYVTGGASSRVIGDGVHGAGSVAIDTAATAIAVVATPETAQAAKSTAEAGVGLVLDAARHSTAALTTVAGRSVGIDVDPNKPGDEISTVLGRNPVGRAAIETVNTVTRTQNHDDAVKPATAESTTPTDAAPATSAGHDGLTPAQRLLHAKDAAAEKAKAVAEAAAESGAMEKVKEMAKKGGIPAILGALFGIDKDKGLVKSLPMMGVLATLFTLLWDKVKESGMMGSGHNRRSNSTYADMDTAMRTYGEKYGDGKAPAAATPQAQPSITAAPAANDAKYSAGLKKSFDAQAALPPPAPEVDKTTTSYAFSGAASLPKPGVQVIAAPGTLATNDPQYRQYAAASPSMM